jgi:hypothetical protein
MQMRGLQMSWWHCQWQCEDQKQAFDSSSKQPTWRQHMDCSCSMSHSGDVCCATCCGSLHARQALSLMWAAQMSWWHCR